MNTVTELVRLYAEANIRIGTLERENAALRRENAALKIERNRYKVALEDIALANDQWPGYKAREVLEKEAQP